MQREQLKEVLAHIKPAVSTTDIIPSMRCVFFDGEHAHAWDDTIAAKVPCEIELDGGVPAPELIDWVGKATGEVVTVTEEESAVTFKCGRSKLRLPLTPLEEYQWEEQHDMSDDSINPDDIQQLALAFKRILPAIGSDPEMDKHFGVSVTALEDGTVMLSATNELIAMIQGVNFQITPLSTTVHPRFAALMAKLIKDENIQDVRFSDAWTDFTMKDGSSYWCRTCPAGDFSDLDQLAVKVGAMEFSDLPEGFAESVSRAVAATKGSENPTLDMKVMAKEIRMHAQGKLTELDDTLAASGHKSTRATLVPKLISLALIEADQYALDPEFALVFKNEEQLSVCMTVVAKE